MRAPCQKAKSKLGREDVRHLNALVRTILFVELFYGFQADPIVEKALKVWHKELLRVSGGTTSPLEVSGAGSGAVQVLCVACTPCCAAWSAWYALVWPSTSFSLRAVLAGPVHFVVPDAF